jgi:ribosome-associated toxin RatA of RatAB toxin-antitoxin module
VPTYEATARATVRASAEECFAAMTDWENLPSWQGALKRCAVVERDEQGRAALVDYEVDARVRTVRYRLRQDYDEPRRLGSTYVEGDFRAFAGTWYFDQRADGSTDVRLELAIDPGRFVPGPVARLIRETVARRAVDDLKRHLEAPARSARAPNPSTGG